MTLPTAAHHTLSWLADCCPKKLGCNRPLKTTTYFRRVYWMRWSFLRLEMYQIFLLHRFVTWCSIKSFISSSLSSIQTRYAMTFQSSITQKNSEFPHTIPWVEGSISFMVWPALRCVVFLTWPCLCAIISESSSSRVVVCLKWCDFSESY